MNFRWISGKVLFALIIFGIVMVFTGIFAEAAEMTIRVKVQNANIRLKPTTESMIISQVPIGAVFSLKGAVGEWYKVDLPPDENGVVVTGYIHKSMVEALEEPYEAPKIQEEPRAKKIAPPPVPQPFIQRRLPLAAKDTGITGKGLKLGLGMANFFGDDVEGAESKFGLSFGGFITYNFTEMIAVQPELHYAMKGAKHDESVGGTDYHYSANLSYLEIPVLAKLCFQTQTDMKPGVYVGPYLGLKMSAKSKLKVDDKTETDDMEHVKSTDFGLVFGAGVDFSLSFLVQGKMTLDARYSMGLTTIQSGEEGDGEEVDVKNKVIAVLVGYSF